jgi:hypothetical protein
MNKYITLLLAFLTCLLVYLGYQSYNEHFSGQGNGSKYNNMTNKFDIVSAFLFRLRQEKAKYTSNNRALNMSSGNVSYFDNAMEHIIDIMASELDGYHNKKFELSALLSFIVGSLAFVDVLDNTDDEKKKIKNIIANRLTNYYSHQQPVDLNTKFTNLLDDYNNHIKIKTILVRHLAPYHFGENDMKIVKNLLSRNLTQLQDIFVDSYIYGNTDDQTLKNSIKYYQLMNNKETDQSKKLSADDYEKLENLNNYAQCVHMQTTKNNTKKTKDNKLACDFQFDYMTTKNNIENGQIKTPEHWLGIQDGNPYTDIETELLKIKNKITEINELPIAFEYSFANSGTDRAESNAEIIGNNTITHQNQQTGAGNNNVMPTTLGQPFEVNRQNIDYQNHPVVGNGLSEVSGYQSDANSIVPILGSALGLTSGTIADVNGQSLVDNKPYTDSEDVDEDNNNAKYPEILNDRTCKYRKDPSSCQQQITDISHVETPSYFKNKPVNLIQSKTGPKPEFIDTVSYSTNQKAYNVNQVNQVAPRNHSVGPHVWSSNNIDDNFNQLDTRPLIVQSHIKGVSNIFAPLIYIQRDGQIKQEPIGYKYQFNDIAEPDLLNDNNSPEPNNENTLFEKNNVMIPA